MIDAEGTLVVTADRKAWIAGQSQAELTELGAAMVVGNAAFAPSVRALSLKDDAGVEVLSLAPPSDESTYLRVCEVMSVPPGGGDVGEYVVVTNTSDSVTLDLAGIFMSATKTGDANPKMSFTCETNALPLAPGATYRFDQADWWPSGKITNNKVDMIVRDAAGAVVQTLHFETGWTGFEATDGGGASLLALDFGDTVTQISQWAPSPVPEPGHVGAKSAEGFVILHESDGDYDATKPLTFATLDPAGRTIAISASMVPPDSGTTATLTLLYKTDLRAAGYSEAEVQVSDIDATSGTATVTLPAAFDNIDTAFFFGFKNEGGVDD